MNANDKTRWLTPSPPIPIDGGEGRSKPDVDRSLTAEEASDNEAIPSDRDDPPPEPAPEPPSDAHGEIGAQAREARSVATSGQA
jgi:hypothetical protein